MSSFLFLHFCDDVFELLGLYFSAVSLSKTFLRWLFTRVDSRPTLICWVFNAEKPSAFPQEKTDTSYPRASLGSCLGNCCSHGFNRAGLGLGWCRSPTWLSKPHTALHRASCGFLCPKTRLPLLLKGEGRGITFLGLVGFALLVQNWGTLAQQGRSGALVVSFPYLASRTAHRATQGRVWVHHFFLERFCPGRTAKSRSSL